MDSIITLDILVLQYLGCNLVLSKNHDLLLPLVTLLVLWMKTTPPSPSTRLVNYGMHASLSL